MCITAYSLTMACIWTSVLVVIMCAIQNNKRTLQYFGINNMLILYAFCIIRMLVPIELPHTKMIPLETLYNTATHLCRNTIVDESLRVSDVLLFAWGVGILVCVFELIKDYQTTKQNVRACTIQTEGLAWELLGKLQKEEGDERKIEVYRTPYEVPMVVGILHPAILLPDREYQEADLYYIMKHEYTHILNRDTTVKLLLNLWSCVFWWNPITYLLYNNMEKTLELKCDFTVVGELGKDEKVKYLSAILHAIQNVSKGNERKNLPKSINTLYKAHSQSEILKRFECVSKYSEMTAGTKARYRKYIAVMVVVYSIIFCASYGFVFQSRFDAPTEEVVTEEGIYELRPDNMYLRKKGEMYEIIYKNKCIGVIDETSALLMQEEGFGIKQEEK